MAYSQYFAGLFSQLTSQSCTVDTTPPTFAGITGTVSQDSGAIQASWLAATTSKPPIQYLIYIALGSVSAGTLFQASNLVKIVPAGNLNGLVFTLADQTTYLVKGLQYTLGVRAQDALGYSDSNTAISVVTAIASGNLAAVFQNLADDFDADHVDFQADHAAFIADDAAFDADHVNFQADHANFVADNVVFQSIAAAASVVGGKSLTLKQSQSIMELTETRLSMEITIEPQLIP